MVRRWQKAAVGAVTGAAGLVMMGKAFHMELEDSSRAAEVFFSLSASERAECRALGQPAKATLETGDDPVDCRIDEPDNTKAWLLFSIGSGCLVLGNVVIGRSLRDLGQLTDEIYAAEAAHHEPPVSIGDPQH